MNPRTSNRSDIWDVSQTSPYNASSRFRSVSRSSLSICELISATCARRVFSVVSVVILVVCCCLLVFVYSALSRFCSVLNAVSLCHHAASKSSQAWEGTMPKGAQHCHCAKPVGFRRRRLSMAHFIIFGLIRLREVDFMSGIKDVISEILFKRFHCFGFFAPCDSIGN